MINIVLSFFLFIDILGFELAYLHSLDSNGNKISFFNSGVNTPIPKMQITHTEPMASASP